MPRRIKIRHSIAVETQESAIEVKAISILWDSWLAEYGRGHGIVEATKPVTTLSQTESLMSIIALKFEFKEINTAPEDEPTKNI